MKNKCSLVYLIMVSKNLPLREWKVYYSVFLIISIELVSWKGTEILTENMRKQGKGDGKQFRMALNIASAGTGNLI